MSTSAEDMKNQLDAVTTSGVDLPALHRAVRSSAPLDPNLIKMFINTGGMLMKSSMVIPLFIM